MTDIALLQGTELFAELDDDALQSVVDASSSRELRRGDVVFTEGSLPEHLYVVEDGRIAIASKSDDGRAISTGRPDASAVRMALVTALGG